VSIHEHFEVLCAAASIGQAAPEELLELERHCSECAACRNRYADYLTLSARQFAFAEHNPVLSAQDADECLNSDHFTRRFFQRAERQGIVFSREVGRDVNASLNPPAIASRRVTHRSVMQMIAAAAAVALAASAGYFYRGSSTSHSQMSAQIAQVAPSVSVSSDTGAARAALNERVTGLSVTNIELQSRIDRLSAELSKTSSQLHASEADRAAASEGRQKMLADRDALQAELKDVRQELAQSQALAAGAQQEAAEQRDRASDVTATLVADQVKIHDLSDDLQEKTAALDKEHQLLTESHDVTDLMGARNLHIVDVVDTDPHGNTRRAFGRVFFTEGKSLVFYAYDLSEAKLQKANYQYQVWAKKEGPDKQVRSMGVFYSDDKTQRRWVFKCDDAKILSEIDSVFVTLEPPGSDPNHPKGANLMYAYLHGQPNHP
jgi:hypothetical protein